MATARAANFNPHFTACLIELIKKEILRYSKALPASQLDLKFTIYEVTYLAEVLAKSTTHRFHLILFGRSAEAAELLQLNRQLLQKSYLLLKQYFNTFKSAMPDDQLMLTKLNRIALYRAKIANLSLHLSQKSIETYWQQLEAEIKQLHQEVNDKKPKLDKMILRSLRAEDKSHLNLMKGFLCDYTLICALDFINLISLDGETAPYKLDIVRNLMATAQAIDSSAIDTEYYKALEELLNNPLSFTNSPPSPQSNLSTSLIATQLKASNALLSEDQKLSYERTVFFYLYDITQHISLTDSPANSSYSAYHGYDWDNTLVRYNASKQQHELIHEDLWIEHFKNSPKNRRNDIVTAAPWTPWLEERMFKMIDYLNEKIGNPPGTNTLFHSIAYATGRNKEPYLRYLKDKELPQLSPESFCLTDDMEYNIFLCKRGGFRAILANPNGQPTHFKALAELEKGIKPALDTTSLVIALNELEEKKEEEEDAFLDCHLKF